MKFLLLEKKQKEDYLNQYSCMLHSAKPGSQGQGRQGGKQRSKGRFGKGNCKQFVDINSTPTSSPKFVQPGVEAIVERSLPAVCGASKWLPARKLKVEG